MTKCIEQKYIVKKADGTAVDPKEKYFVLRYDGGSKDRAASMALAYYALLHNDETLSQDLLRETYCDMGQGSGSITTAASVDKDVEECWQGFWKNIVTTNGQVDLDKVKRELYDFSRVLDYVPRVYCHITGDLISKVLTDPCVVCNAADAHYDEMYSEDE